MLRPVGNLELASTSRHSLGLYRNVIVTARYRLPSADPSHATLEGLIEPIVCQIVLSHPALNIGIVDEHAKNPYFVRLDQIDVLKCIEYRIDDSETGEDMRDKNNELLLTKVIEEQHGRCFPDIHKRPGWRLVILPAKCHKDYTTDFYACFVFHHAIGDGTSGMVFHRSFLNALQNSINSTAREGRHVVQVSKSLTLTPPVEKLIKFKLTWTFMATKILETFGPAWIFPPATAWTGGLISMPSMEDYKSRLILLSYQPYEASVLLSACRAHKGTLTGLIHGVIVASLSKLVPEAQAFSGCTPYSLRSLSGSSMTKDMVVQVSSFSSEYPSLDTTDATTTEAQIWNIAQKFSADVKAETSNLPNDNMVGMLGYVSDWHAMWKAKLGKARENTFEVSNIGAFVDGKVRSSGWKMEQLIFTQPGMVTGATLCFSVASVKEALLTMSISWQEGVLDEALVRNIAADVDATLRAIGA